MKSTLLDPRHSRQKLPDYGEPKSIERLPIALSNWLKSQATYDAYLLKNLSENLTAELGKGYSKRNLELTHKHKSLPMLVVYLSRLYYYCEHERNRSDNY